MNRHISLKHCFGNLVTKLDGVGGGGGDGGDGDGDGDDDVVVSSI